MSTRTPAPTIDRQQMRARFGAATRFRTAMRDREATVTVNLDPSHAGPIHRMREVTPPRT